MLEFPNYGVYQSLKIYLRKQCAADPDEVPHSAAFHLVLQCLSRFSSQFFLDKILNCRIF